MPQLKSINYPKMLYSVMGRYFSINDAGELSRLYKYCMCILMPLQNAWYTFDIWRRKKQLIAYCNWQYGQLANVLNYLYDSLLNRIYISYSNIVGLFAPDIDYESSVFAQDIDANYFDNTSTLKIGTEYFVTSGIIVYTGTTYTTGQTFTTISGFPTFVGSGTVTFNTFAPDIDAPYSVNQQIYINIPNSIYIDDSQRSDLISTLEQIKLTGLTYQIQSI